MGIFSSAPLPRGAEITIPFEFQFEEYRSNLDCACAQDSCAVMKHNLRFQNQIQDGHTQKRFKPHDEDSNSGSHQKMSPLGVSLANSHGMQVCVCLILARRYYTCSPKRTLKSQNSDSGKNVA